MKLSYPLGIAIAVVTALLNGAQAQSEMDKEIRGQKQRVISNGLLMASPCRTHVTEMLQNGGSMKCPKVEDSSYVVASTEDGHITIYFKSGGEGVQGRSVPMVPIASNGPAKASKAPQILKSWRCGSARDLTYGKLPDKEYMPGHCRG